MNGELPILPKADLYVSTPGATASITPGTPINICSGSTTALGDIPNVDFTMVSAGKLRYDGLTTKQFAVSSIMSMSISVGNRLISLFVAKNGVEFASSEQQRKVASSSDLGNASVCWSVSLDTGDFVEIFVDSDQATTITPVKMCFIVKQQL